MRKTSVVVLAAAAACLCPAPAVAQDPTIAAAGDIACLSTDLPTPTTCQHKATSDLLVGAPLAAVLPLGDLVQFGGASLRDYNTNYDPTWGRVKSISRPVIGNHDGSPPWTGYFDYVNGVRRANGPAGRRGKGWYSFDVGSWHLVALNSNCEDVSCAAGSEQERWLRADLAAHPNACTLAYSHHARFSSGHDNTFMQPFWQALDDYGVELLLSAHSHIYERIAPRDRNGALDPATGVRQFVIGTGGAFFTGGLGLRTAHSEVGQNTVFGVLFVTLHPTSYDWRFVPAGGGPTYADAGSAACHTTPPPPDTTPPVISNLTAKPQSFSVARKAWASRKRWTTFRYELLEAATVRVTVSQRFRGRRVSGKCRRSKGLRRGAPRCVGYRKVGSFTQQGAAGANRRKFRGRFGRRYLNPGKFKAGFVATDAAGNRSGRKSVRFTIVRARRS